jgi:hypothetical protein
MTQSKGLPPTCGAAHDRLRPAEQHACSQAMPAGPQEQAGFLFARFGGNLAALAAVLNVRPRSLKRQLEGSRLPPSPRLRRSLEQGAVRYACPIEVALQAEEARRQAERDARRAKRQGERYEPS